MKSFKQFVFALVLVSIAVLIAPPVVSAHVLKVDGTIGAILHVDSANASV